MTENSQNENHQVLDFNQALLHFITNGVNTAEGASLNQIIELESKVDFKFPDDFKEFYLLSNGFLDGEMDENHFSIWTLERIEKSYIDTKYTEPNFIPISDYLTNCWQYGYVKGKEGIYLDNLKDTVAKDFSELINLIIRDSHTLY